MGVFGSISGGDHFTGHQTFAHPDGAKYVGEFKDGLIIQQKKVSRGKRR
jgi:hypothetical protein